MDMYNLFLDDERDSRCLQDTKTWETVRSYNEFVDKITKDGPPGFISFDHDLDDAHYPKEPGEALREIDYNHPKYKVKSGYHCALWLIEYCKKMNVPLPKWQVHSMHMTGRYNITKVMREASKI
jgi:hypothetical protein